MTNHHGPAIAQKDNLIVIKCRECKFAHLHPLPDPIATTRYYSDYDAEYSTPDGAAWLDKEKAEHEADLWDSAYRWQALLLNYGSLLDVGAGAGWFVRWWDKNVCPAAYGVEPSKICRTIGPPMLSTFEQAQKVLTDVPLANIRLSLVLEHVLDPETLLRQYVELLRPGGRVMAIVPNEFNPLQMRVARKRGDWFVDGRHINYFTGPTLAKLFNRVGLRVRYLGATHPTEWWPIRWGPQFHRGRLRFERLVGPRIFGLYTRLYHSREWGREIVMVGEK
jgi:SAM-dependent methyltransferase